METWRVFRIKDRLSQQPLGRQTDDRKPAHACIQGNILYSILRDAYKCKISSQRE